MLKLRIMTVMVLFPFTLYSILFLSNAHFALVIGGIMLLAAYEWAGLAGFPTPLTKMAFVVIVATVIYSIWLINFLLSSDFMNLIAVFFWFFSSILVFKYPKSAFFWKDKSLIIAIMGIFLFLLTWYAAISIHAIEGFQFAQQTINGPHIMLFCMMLIWSADTGAYFSGRRFGNKKLAIKISPGKSWEGVYGGLILAIFIAFLSTIFYQASLQDYLNILIITIATVSFTVIGDLMESMFKRQAGVKDSGKILPGHGGILDRIDGVIAAVPIFFITISQLYKL
ncbi:MAG: phosphatidate cytidylyltransferase [gamma proteobacterium symbiont of Taylorina sp.]|nr:phosphatidate cytidylyltransferase [gamma proteobacterium symbiont of Taylorina sp.]